MTIAVRLTPALATLAAACTTHVDAPELLRFSAPEGPVLNEFYRQGPTAAHLVATPGRTPRLVVAFPAGNSGAALWFDASSAALSWRPDVTMEAARRELPDGGVLRGVTADLAAAGGPITIKKAILSSVRVIRQYEDARATPTEVLTVPQVSGREIVWQRRRLDGGAGYYLSIEMLSGAIRERQAGEARAFELSPDSDGRLRMRVTALTGDPPLTPIAKDDLLVDGNHRPPAREAQEGSNYRPLAREAGEGQGGGSSPDAHLRRILAFLSYEEKLLAGSWRFNTYFGRDTLMSLRLLAPVLQPAVTEAGLASVLERLSASGEVAHEEDIGEFAVLRRMRAGLPPDDAPIFDYKMIDDDFMLAIVAAHYLLETAEGRARAAAFLSRSTASGDAYGARLAANLQFVVTTAAPFARDPDWRRLIALKPGEYAGNWRDSEDGLGGGRYPYDVNGVFAPAALDAIGRLHASGVLQAWLDSDADAMLARARAMADVWRREAPPLFDVAVSSKSARIAVEEYARRIGVEPSASLTAIEDGSVGFRAVALDAHGRPIPILNSDEAFALLFLNPAPAEAQRIANTLARPFPAGLMTGVGMVVANPAYAPDDLEPRFDRSRYHGSVIWSWQQAMFAAGLERQLGRDDLTESARGALTRARDTLRAAIEAAGAVRGSELWSWSATDGRYRLESFGQHDADETESNAAQLWSTVHLAVTGD